MNFFTVVNSYLHLIAGLLIFVASYLAIVLCAIMCILIAELISDHGGVTRAYAVRSGPSDGGRYGGRGGCI
jgi:hypothetical protein